MGRSSKSAKLHEARTESKAQMQIRIETEEKLQGKSDKVKPSTRLNSNQKKIFQYIVTELEQSKLLGNLDSFLLETGVIAIDRLQNIEKMINQDFELIRDRELMQAKDKYTKDFLKGCEKFGLSPIDRAKFALATGKKVAQESDPLLSVLKNKSS